LAGFDPSTVGRISPVHRGGGQYPVRRKELWHLRNSLAHNAINAASQMSATTTTSNGPTVELEHLKLERTYLFVHTGRLLDDFRAAVDELEREFQRDPVLLSRAESRLEIRHVEIGPWGTFPTTPPPPMVFPYVQQPDEPRTCPHCGAELCDPSGSDG
jgi:hypothetical protein